MELQLNGIEIRIWVLASAVFQIILLRLQKWYFREDFFENKEKQVGIAVSLAISASRQRHK